MTHITNDFLQFYRDLAANNNRDWFNENKKRYEQTVKKPFEALVAELIDRVHALEPDVRIQPKDAIFRIHRDVRFAKDKTPYKLHSAAVISSGGRKSHDIPGMYVHIGPEGGMVGGGAYMLDKISLYNVRLAISNNLEAFDNLVNDKRFTEKYGLIKGEANKVLPKEFKEAAAVQPLIANKQFYYMADLDESVVVDAALPDIVMEYHAAGARIGAFLKEAMKG